MKSMGRLVYTYNWLLFLSSPFWSIEFFRNVISKMKVYVCTNQGNIRTAGQRIREKTFNFDTGNRCGSKKYFLEMTLRGYNKIPCCFDNFQSIGIEEHKGTQKMPVNRKHSINIGVLNPTSILSVGQKSG